jgi:hypothetical protein
MVNEIFMTCTQHYAFGDTGVVKVAFNFREIPLLTATVTLFECHLYATSVLCVLWLVFRGEILSRRERERRDQ